MTNDSKLMVCIYVGLTCNIDHRGHLTISAVVDDDTPVEGVCLPGQLPGLPQLHPARLAGVAEILKDVQPHHPGGGHSLPPTIPYDQHTEDYRYDEEGNEHGRHTEVTLQRKDKLILIWRLRWKQKNGFQSSGAPGLQGSRAPGLQGSRRPDAPHWCPSLNWIDIDECPAVYIYKLHSCMSDILANISRGPKMIFPWVLTLIEILLWHFEGSTTQSWISCRFQLLRNSVLFRSRLGNSILFLRMTDSVTWVNKPSCRHGDIIVEIIRR